MTNIDGWYRALWYVVTTSITSWICKLLWSHILTLSLCNSNLPHLTLMFYRVVRPLPHHQAGDRLLWQHGAGTVIGPNAFMGWHWNSSGSNGSWTASALPHIQNTPFRVLLLGTASGYPAFCSPTFSTFYRQNREAGNDKRLPWPEKLIRGTAPLPPVQCKWGLESSLE